MSKRSPVVALCIVALVATIVRALIAYYEPITAIPLEGVDEGWMFARTLSLLNGDWLGAISSTTLVKNPGYPLIVSSGLSLGIPYSLIFVALIALGALASALSLKPLYSSPWIGCALYILFLWMPCLFTNEFYQRFYRAGMVVPLTLLVISGYVGLYLRRSRPVGALIPFCLLSSISLPFFWLMKEDSSWITPLITVASLLMLSTWYMAVKQKTADCRDLMKRVCLLVAPPLTCVLVLSMVCFQNYEQYGVWLTNEKSDGPIADVYSDLSDIDTGEHDALVAVSYKAMSMAYEVSPTLASIEAELNSAMDDNRAAFQNNDAPWTTEVLLDHVEWDLIRALDAAGGYTSQLHADDFWRKVDREINDAFDAGRLPRRTGCVKLSKLASPLYPEDFMPWLSRSIKSSIKLIIRPACTISYEAGVGNRDDQREYAHILHTHETKTDAISEESHDCSELIALKLAGAEVNTQGIQAITLFFAALISYFMLIRHREHLSKETLPDISVIAIGLLLSAFEIQLAIEWLFPTTSGITTYSTGMASFFYGGSSLAAGYFACAVPLCRYLQLARDIHSRSIGKHMRNR